MHQRITREIGNRSHQVIRQPWRLLRNRRLRQEIDLLMEISGSKKEPPATSG
jgi:hypothetical protein